MRSIHAVFAILVLVPSAATAQGNDCLRQLRGIAYNYVDENIILSEHTLRAIKSRDKVSDVSTRSKRDHINTRFKWTDAIGGDWESDHRKNRRNAYNELREYQAIDSGSASSFVERYGKTVSPEVVALMMSCTTGLKPRVAENSSGVLTVEFSYRSNLDERATYSGIDADPGLSCDFNMRIGEKLGPRRQQLVCRHVSSAPRSVRVFFDAGTFVAAVQGAVPEALPIVIEAGAASRFDGTHQDRSGNSCRDSLVYDDQRVAGRTTNAVDYRFVSAASADYHLYLHYTSAIPRPVRITVNGVRLPGHYLRSATPKDQLCDGWGHPTVRRSRPIGLSLRAGANTLRIESHPRVVGNRTGDFAFPHLALLEFIPSD